MWVIKGKLEKVKNDADPLDIHYFGAKIAKKIDMIFNKNFSTT